MLSGRIFYLHFGTPCSSWGPAGRLDRGTRSKTRPEWDGPLPREAMGNHQADQTAKLCQALVKVNGCFSIKNPAGSYFLYSPIADLGRAASCYLVRFCQCAYGLRFPRGKKNEFCQKNTYLFTNMKELRSLERKCPGISASHTCTRVGLDEGRREVGKQGIACWPTSRGTVLRGLRRYILAKSLSDVPSAGPLGMGARTGRS